MGYFRFAQVGNLSGVEQVEVNNSPWTGLYSRQNASCRSLTERGVSDNLRQEKSYGPTGKQVRNFTRST